MNKKDTVPIICLVLLAILTIFTAFNPRAFITWLLEIIFIWLFVLVLILTYKKLRFSNYVYLFLLVFMTLPVIGGYYGFDFVPYGQLLDFENQTINNFDRLVHLFFGLFLTPFIYELIKKTSPIKKGLWLFIIPISLSLATGAAYELIEWSSAYIFAPEAVDLWIGLKGDNWDAQKDMFLGFIGSIITMSIITLSDYKKTSKKK